MKTYIKRYLLLLLLVFTGNVLAQAQSTQSAMYDAIALMNASNGVNAVFNAKTHGYDIIDPLSGKVALLNQDTTAKNYLGNAAASNAIILAILARNAGFPANAGYNTVKAAYAGNPFLSPIFLPATQSFAITYDPALSGYGRATSSPKSGADPSTLGGNLANGVADFLVQRAGEELSVAVFQKLKTFIGQYPEFGVLFPRTIALLGPVQPYDYAKTLKALKAALQEDLAALPANLPQLYSLPRYQLLNKKIPELTLVFSSAQLFTSLHGKSSLARSLHDLDTAACLKEANNYATLVHLTILSSNSLRKKLLADPEDAEYGYFTAADLALATHGGTYTPQLGKYYLGLLYQQLAPYQFYDQDGAHPLAGLIGRYAADTGTALQQMADAAGQLNNLEQQLLALKIKDDGLHLTGQNPVSAGRFVLYNQLLDTAMTLLKPLISGAPATLPWKAQLQSLSSYWPQFSGSAVALIKDMEGKNYTLAVNDLSTLFTNLSAYLDQVNANKAADTALNNELSQSLTTKLNTVAAKITALDQSITQLQAPRPQADPNVQAAIAIQLQNIGQSKAILTKLQQSLQWEKDNGAQVLASLSKILGYVDLLASLSQAGNAQEVQSILEAYALPAGSSRVKKDAAASIALNAYVGGFYRPNSTGTGFTNQYGLTAPIGVTFSWGEQKLGSASLFLSAVDIGSVIRYKLDNQGQYEQNVNLAGLVSPGVHFVYGFGAYLPLSAGIGCQWISPVTSASNSISLQPYFNIFLAVDIPLFNLSVTKPKAH